jgi:hypothetical protein
MDISKLNNGRSQCPFNIDAVEKKYNAKYVGELCLKSHGNWVNAPASIFYQETPPVEGYSKYFALIIQNGTALITSGESAVSEPIWAIEANDGELIYSCYRHDYKESNDKSVFIDGGRDYVRASHSNLIPLEVKDGKFQLAQLDLNKDKKHSM